MRAPHSTPDSDARRSPRPRGWLLPLLAVATGVAAVRLTYLAWLSPYDLVADEAHYWEWSRRLALSYYTKGPGVAWAIAASTRLLGDAAWAVRLPAVVMASGMLMVAGLLGRSIGGSRRAGWYAAAAIGLAPVYAVTAILMTIDGPHAACWLAAVGAVWAADRAADDDTGRWRVIAWWAAAGLAVGVGVLFKYTALLLIPGLLGWAWMYRRELWHGRGGVAWLSLSAAAGVFAVTVSPILI